MDNQPKTNVYPRELLIHKFIYRLDTQDRLPADGSMLWPISLIAPIANNAEEPRNEFIKHYIKFLNNMKITLMDSSGNIFSDIFENVKEIHLKPKGKEYEASVKLVNHKGTEPYLLYNPQKDKEKLIKFRIQYFGKFLSSRGLGL